MEVKLVEKQPRKMGCVQLTYCCSDSSKQRRIFSFRSEFFIHQKIELKLEIDLPNALMLSRLLLATDRLRASHSGGYPQLLLIFKEKQDVTQYSLRLSLNRTYAKKRFHHIKDLICRLLYGYRRKFSIFAPVGAQINANDTDNHYTNRRFTR